MRLETFCILFHHTDISEMYQVKVELFLNHHVCLGIWV